jgi:predicted AAA+ superfamily ATPase
LKIHPHTSKLRLILELQGRFFQKPVGSFFLLGPRGTGKSTWLRRELPDALVVNLLDALQYRELAARPERLAALVRGAQGVQDVVVDEVQRVPELLSVVHALMQEPNAPRFVLTGSSARKLRRGGVDLLAGRATLRTLHPFMAGEWPRADLPTQLRLGMVPLVVNAADPRDTLRAYATLYLQQEVQAEGLVRNVGTFARFLEVVSFSHGGVLNVTNIARETSAGRKMVEHFLEILEELLVAFTVPVFTRRAQRALAAHPKFYLFDAGVYRALRPRGPLDRDDEIDGAGLEGLVAQHLRAWAAYSLRDVTLHTWRTRSGVEVDFVGYGPGDFWAVEVKHADVVRPSDVRGLLAFGEDYPEADRVLLYRGEASLLVSGVRCVSVERFLRALHPARTLADAVDAASRP